MGWTAREKDRQQKDISVNLSRVAQTTAAEASLTNFHLHSLS